MKSAYKSSLVVLGILVAGACKQEMIDLQPPTTPTPPVVTYSKGSADFSKYVAIGNSLTAGFQAGALFTEGQNNSFPLILNKSFQAAGGSTTFNQPDINSVNGYNASASAAAGFPLGRFILFSGDGVQADAKPTPAGYPGVPAPYNTADIPTPYAGDKSKLNNFGVPGIILGQVLTPATGDPTPGNPAFNPLYARFASAPGSSTIIHDALAAKPTFFTFDLGNNDVLGYATTGGDGSIPITDQAHFQGYYATAIAILMDSLPSVKGAVSTIPDVTSLPFFFTVGYNPIPLDQPTADELTSQLANNYNAFLQGMAQAHVISSDEATQRTLSYTASANNAILIDDSDLTDLAPYMAGPYAGLAPYHQARQATAADLIPLTAGGILGTSPGGNPANGVYGVSIPLADEYVLVPSETDSILTATVGFNQTIKAIAAQYPDRIAVADVNATFSALVSNHFAFVNNVTITPDFTPPTGAFSEDGVHPNSRGYAYLANIFITAIEAKFGATLPAASLADYAGVGLPIVVGN